MQFYKTIFGWCFTKQEGLLVEYYDIDTGGIRGGLLQRPAPMPPTGSGANAFVCSVQVNDFDKTVDTILANADRSLYQNLTFPVVAGRAIL